MLSRVKTVEVSNVQFSPHSSPISLVFAGYVSPKILTGVLIGDVKKEWGGKTSHFLALCVNVSKRYEEVAYSLSVGTKVDDLG